MFKYAAYTFILWAAQYYYEPEGQDKVIFDIENDSG